ncbi:MAG: hypothetical protein Q9216_002193 [Gyalolechia sp. 2 TL-2023]
MAASRTIRNPSPYIPLPFHLLRLGQLISALIVTGVVSYFVHFLLLEHYQLPWTFIFVSNPSSSPSLQDGMCSPPPQLLTASVLTIFALIVSGALCHFRTLPPKYNLTNNAALSVLWILGLSFLTWNTGWTLGHRCLIDNWKTEAGIMVCRLYKACTAFTVTGLYDPFLLRQILHDLLTSCRSKYRLTTLLALLLDIRTQRKTTQLGKYNQMHERDSKRSIPIISSPMPQYEPYSSQRADNSGDLGVQRPYRVQESIEVGHFGYNAPTEQTRYDPAHGRY